MIVLSCARPLPREGYASPALMRAVQVRLRGRALECRVGVGSSQWVALHGKPIRLAEAKLYFPDLEYQLSLRGLTYAEPPERAALSAA